MNAWIAPWFLCSLLAGALVPSVGYTGVFVGSLVCSLFGVILLVRVEDPRRSHLALSSE